MIRKILKKRGQGAGTLPRADAPPRPEASSLSKSAVGGSPPTKFPDTFLFGSATASYQVESGLHESDWHQWEKKKGKIRHGDRADAGPDFGHVNPDGSPGGNFRAYIAEAKAMGHTAFRLSLDWSRIQPSQNGPYDAGALRLYHAMLDACHEHGLKPMVTLYHFALPIWAHDVEDPSRGLGGWAGREGIEPGKAPIVDAFAKFAGDMAKEFGGKVDMWLTLNEPMVAVFSAYVDGSFPGPGPRHMTQGHQACVNFAHAHARAYDAIKAQSPASQVGLAQAMRVYRPARPRGRADREAADQLEYLTNALFLDAATTGDVDWNGDGNFDGPWEGRGLEQLRNRLDFVGINYYTREKAIGLPGWLSRAVLGAGSIELRGIPLQTILQPLLDMLRIHFPNTTDLGWERYPQGMYECLTWAAKRYQMPIFVTENGIAVRDAPDTQRPTFLLEHIDKVAEAIRDGADVRGYLYWTLMDNFEWNLGFDPRFGLLRVNYADPERGFTRTQGAEAFSDIIQAGGVTDDVRNKWQPPAPPSGEAHSSGVWSRVIRLGRRWGGLILPNP